MPPLPLARHCVDVRQGEVLRPFQRMSRKGVDICDGMVFNNHMSNTNTAAAFNAMINGMIELRREAAPEMTDDEIAAHIKASLIEMMCR